MGRCPAQSLQADKSLAQLLALNALFDAARAGEGGRASAAAIKIAQQVAVAADFADPECDAMLTGCYAALMDTTDRPSRFS